MPDADNASPLKNTIHFIVCVSMSVDDKLVITACVCEWSQHPLPAPTVSFLIHPSTLYY